MPKFELEITWNLYENVRTYCFTVLSLKYSYCRMKDFLIPVSPQNVALILKLITTDSEIN